MRLRSDNWRKSVTSYMIMRCDKRPKFAFFQSLLPLFANTRVLRALVKIFRSSLDATHCLLHFLIRGIPSHPYTKFTIIHARSGNHPLSVLSSHWKRWSACLCRECCWYWLFRWLGQGRRNSRRCGWLSILYAGEQLKRRNVSTNMLKSKKKL